MKHLYLCATIANAAACLIATQPSAQTQMRGVTTGTYVCVTDYAAAIQARAGSSEPHVGRLTPNATAQRFFVTLQAFNLLKEHDRTYIREVFEHDYILGDDTFVATVREFFPFRTSFLLGNRSHLDRQTQNAANIYRGYMDETFWITESRRFSAAFYDVGSSYTYQGRCEKIN